MSTQYGLIGKKVSFKVGGHTLVGIVTYFETDSEWITVNVGGTLYDVLLKDAEEVVE